MLRHLGTRLAAGALAALVLGVLAGGVARLLMRVLVLLTDEVPRFSVTGTVGIIAIFALMMLPGALAAALGARRTSRVLLALGVAVLLFESVVIPLQEDRTAFTTAEGLVQALTVVVLLAFPVVILAQAVATAQLARALARRFAQPARTAERAALVG
jgi:hypothetical protein